MQTAVKSWKLSQQPITLGRLETTPKLRRSVPRLRIVGTRSMAAGH